MAKTDIGPKISVDGETEYRKQMRNIIQQQKEYSSELSLVTAELGKNSTAQQRATSIGAVLKKQIQAQESALSAQSTMLQKVIAKEGDASTAASAYRTAINKTGAELATLKSRLSDAESGMGEFADKANSSSDSLAKSVTAGTLAAKAFETVGSALFEAGKKVVETGVTYNAQLEQYQTALTNMLGSSTAAQEVLENIKQDAAKTPFDTAGLVKANELLISTGVDASSARNTILALGDAVSATGGGSDELSRMAQNLQQIKNAGKATAADIKQFAYAGIDVYGLLADYTGKSTAEVQKMTVTYDLLTAALEQAADEGGRYYNSMQTQSETLNGQWSTLKDNATQLAGLMTGDLTDAAKSVVSGLNDLTVAAAEAYKTDGWVGLIGKVTGLSDVADRAKSSFAGLKAVIDSLKSGKIGIFHGDWDSVYQKAFNNDLQNQNAGKKDDNYWKQYGDRLAKQYGIEPKKTGSTTPDPASITSDANKSSAAAQKAAADQKKLASSVTDTSTQLLEGTGNIVGAIKQVTETADNTYNVYDGTTKQLKGTTQETAQTITQTWTEMVDGVQKNYKKVVTMLDGVEQSSKITSEDVLPSAKTTSDTRSEKVYGVEGVIGALDRTTQTTQKIEKVVDETTGELRDSVTSTTDVVTEAYTKMVDGVATSVERVTTYVDGQITDIQEKTVGLRTDIKGVQGTVGSFSGFILDLDTKLGGLQKVAEDLTKSPLSNWFSDINKGYRADDSFFDNIDVGGTLLKAGSSFLTTWASTGSWEAGAVSAAVSAIGSLLGTDLSGLANESNGWGQDLVSSMADGMNKAGSWIGDAAKNIADTITSWLHFSRPDVGPLREYEKWMPDMVQGMATGIKKNAYLLRDAARGLSGDLETQLRYDVSGSNPAMTAAYNSRRISMGGVNVNVYPPAGLDAEEVAQYTIDRLQQMIDLEAAANGEVPVF